MKIRKLFGITSLFVMIFLAACSAVPAASSDQPASQPANQVGDITRRTITVAGQGSVTVVPDIAYINVGVHTEGDAVTATLTANTDQAKRVSDALIALGIDPKDIQTTSFNVYPQVNYSPQGELLATRYTVDNTVYVTVRDIARLGEMLDAVVNNGANNINGISFDTSKKEQAVTEARKIAIQDARRQADELTAAAGVQLGDLLVLSAQATGGPSPMYQGRGGAMIESAAVPVSAGQLVISVDVNMTYEMK